MSMKMDLNIKENFLIVAEIFYTGCHAIISCLKGTKMAVERRRFSIRIPHKLLE